MSEETTSKSGKTWLHVRACLYLSFAYAISMGPAVVFYETGFLSSGSYRALYEPLMWASEKTFTHGLLVAYVNIWCAAFGLPLVS